MTTKINWKNKEEVKIYMQKYMKEYIQIPEVKEKIKKYKHIWSKKYRQSPEVIERRNKLRRINYQRPEVKKKEKKRKQKYRQSPEGQIKIRDYRETNREQLTKMARNNICLDCRKQIKNESIRCSSCARTKENNPNWLGGKSFEPYNKFFTNKFKRAIRKRDNYVCMMCGIHSEKLNESLSIHHINYDKKLSIPQNCCATCRSCNSKVNHNRKHYTKFFQDLLAERYEYKYEDGEIILEVNF